MKQIIIATGSDKFVRERFFEYEDIKFIEQYDYAIVKSSGCIELVKIIGYGFLNEKEKKPIGKVLKVITSADWSEINHEDKVSV